MIIMTKLLTIFCCVLCASFQRTDAFRSSSNSFATQRRHVIPEYLRHSMLVPSLRSSSFSLRAHQSTGSSPDSSLLSTTTTTTTTTSISSVNRSRQHEAAQTPRHNRRLSLLLPLLVATAFVQPSHGIDLASAIGTTQPAWWNSLTQTGFYQAFSLVFLSEIGDKTFFIAGILGMKTGRLVSFVGSIAALAAMTVVSVVIGQVFHAVPSGFGDGIPLDDILAVVAFAFFGIKTLKEALDLPEEGGGIMDEELAEAEETVEENRSLTSRGKLGQIASIFTLVFAAEFGDRSFLSTIALSAAQNPVSVAGGAIAAHAAATGIAVSGGSLIAKNISERVIGIIGGSLFIVFAITTAIGIF